MTTACDLTTVELFRRLEGLRLEKLVAHPYPGYLAYSHVIAMFADGLSVRISLSSRYVAPKFEVSVVNARTETANNTLEGDCLKLEDFVVKRVYLLRREEWVEPVATLDGQTVGSGVVEQRFGTIGDIAKGYKKATVDSGVCFVSARGAELDFDADTFPLVLQLRYEVASSPLPKGSRIEVNECRGRSK